jgi:hypothetical protein
LRISLQPSAAASGGEGSAVLLTLADVRPVPGVLSPALPLLLPGVLSRGVDFDGAPASRARVGTGAWRIYGCVELLVGVDANYIEEGGCVGHWVDRALTDLRFPCFIFAAVYKRERGQTLP